MSDVDPTPGTPVTVGDRMGWFRGDVQAQFALLRGLPAADLAQLVAAVAALRGVEPAGDLGQVVSGLTSIQGIGTFNTLAAIGTLLSIFRNEYLLENGYLKDYLSGIYSSVGIPTGDATTTVLGHLAAIERLLTTQVAGLPPVINENTISSTTTTSVSGKKYAIFTPPIAGISISESGIDLTAVNSWSGYYAYVQTNGPTAYLNNAADVVNEWMQLVGTGSYNFSVDQQYTIRVYLRRPNFTGEQLTALSTIWNGLDGRAIPGYAIAWPATYQPNKVAPDGFFTPNRQIYATTNIAGRTIQLISGQCVVCRWTSATPVLNNLNSVGDTFTVPSGFSGRVSVQGATNSAFTIGIST